VWDGAGRTLTNNNSYVAFACGVKENEFLQDAPPGGIDALKENRSR
jgi:hypothetical protein